MKIMVVGDVFLGRRLEQVLTQPPGEVLCGLQNWVNSHDEVFFNLEGPITEADTSILKTGPSLKMNPGSAIFLKNAGLTTATLANNHIFDFGAKGLTDTLSALQVAGLSHVGAGHSLDQAREPHIISGKESSIGILNFAENEWSTTHSASPGANPVNVIDNYRDIKALKKRVDFVVVITHGGHEMCPLPSPSLRERLRFYVEAGASAVLNHHQHVVSGYEVYQGSPIFYGLGNCFFDGGPKVSNEWSKGIAVSLATSKNRLDFEVLHFDQCRDDFGVKECEAAESDRRNQAMRDLGDLIRDYSLLSKAFDLELKKRAKMYRAYLMPTTNRYLQAAHHRGLFPQLLSRDKKKLYLNLIRCESHREAVIDLLQRDLLN
jgi:hypothetical protein